MLRCTSCHWRAGSERLHRAARLVGAVIAVHVPLPQLPAGLVLLPAVAVAVVRSRRLAVLLVTPVTLVMAVGPFCGVAARLLFVSVDGSHPSLGIVQGLEVAVVVTVDDVSLWHHLQVGPDAVVAGARVVAEVDDAALVGALVGRFDSGETKFMGDVASHDLHHLKKRRRS